MMSPEMPTSADAWRGYLVVLHQQRADPTLVRRCLIFRPQSARSWKRTRAFSFSRPARISTAGQPQYALPLLQAARSRYTSRAQKSSCRSGHSDCLDHACCFADEPGLSDLLLNARRRTDLTSKQRDAIEEIYSTWSVRRAEHAFETKPQLAFSILTDAAHEYPGDRNIHAHLASLYLKRHDRQKALDVFQTWGMDGSTGGRLTASQQEQRSPCTRLLLADHFHAPGALNIFRTTRN